MNWELSELTWKVRELAVETGAFIREERKKFNRERIEKNTHTTMCRMWTKNRNEE